jgi:hypothetical protein
MHKVNMGSETGNNWNSVHGQLDVAGKLAAMETYDTKGHESE